MGKRQAGKGAPCTFCASRETKVVDSKKVRGQPDVRLRYHDCLACSRRFKTFAESYLG